MKQKNSKTYWLVFIGVVLAAAVAVFCIWLPYESKTKAPDSNQNSNSTVSNDNANGTLNNSNSSNIVNSNNNANASDNFDNKGVNSNTNSSSPVVNNDSTDPYYYYDLGLLEFSKNNCLEAINYFNKAIALNSSNPNFYIKKSSAQITLNQKQAAIDTINQGLVNIPNDSSLLSQLDFIKNVVK